MIAIPTMTPMMNLPIAPSLALVAVCCRSVPVAARYFGLSVTARDWLERPPSSVQAFTDHRAGGQRWGGGPVSTPAPPRFEALHVLGSEARREWPPTPVLFGHHARMSDVEAPDEVMVSVDVETSGQSPGTGSLIAIGACLVDDPQVGLYLELKPLPGLPWSEQAQAVHKLDRTHLEETGLPASDALQRLEAWLGEVGGSRQPVFVGFNAPFDWMFVADYFERFLGRNPFGISALDLKSYYMGRTGVARWADTRRDVIARRHPVDTPHSHNALQDARGQAELARILFAGGRG